ncbi:MAG: hypothetical protein J5816_02255 [Clostridia bacterium]|nr:hypothetical protein [Clostridia bacterium]
MFDTKIDISHIPFSRYGAYAAIAAVPANSERTSFKELILLYSKLRGGESPMFSVKVGTDEPREFACTADPGSVKISTDRGFATLYIRDDDTIVIDSEGLDFHFDTVSRGTYGTEYGENRFSLIINPHSVYATVYILRGEGKLIADPKSRKVIKRDMDFRCVDGKMRIGITMTLKQPKELPLPISPADDIALIKKEWEEFAALMEDVESADEKTNAFTLLTWYNLWSSFVRADDIYYRDSMLMSKKGMSALWSWDHCFNALAIARCKDREFAKKKAFEQFAAPFWLQTDKGVLPDMWNPDNITRWGTTKPPVHGWCFSRLMDYFEFDKKELETVYGWLEKWTSWWLNYSDTDNDGIPDYPQGCDSGWDNSTLFDMGFYVETPDLPSYLIMQMNTLARISRKLGNEEKAAEWDKKAKELLDRFIAHSWNGERFVPKLSITHEQQENPTSLLSLMPLVLGDLLPKDIFDKLVKVLKRDFITDVGLATEMPASPDYDPDGYWRGPIWAPSTYLITDGLRRGGYEDLATEIAKKYCNMSCNLAKGNYENFDALTGIGRRAPGYTWSASVYMILRGEYVK